MHWVTRRVGGQRVQHHLPRARRVFTNQNPTFPALTIKRPPSVSDTGICCYSTIIVGSVYISTMLAIDVLAKELLGFTCYMYLHLHIKQHYFNNILTK